MGNFFGGLMPGNFFQVLLIDVRCQSKLFLKNGILKLKSAVLAENDIF